MVENLWPTTIPLAFIPGRHSSGWVESGLNAHLADWNYFFEGIRQNTECDCEHKQTHFFHWWGSFTVWHKSEVVVVYTQLKLFLLTAAPMSVSATFFSCKVASTKKKNLKWIPGKCTFLQRDMYHREKIFTVHLMIVHLFCINYLHPLQFKVKARKYAAQLTGAVRET